MIGFRNVDMAELLIHTLTERVAITEGHLFRVAFAIFFQLSQAAEFQDVRKRQRSTVLTLIYW